MAILLAFYSVIKYSTYLIFKGPLNFNIELIFWIFNGILFGPIKGMFFSILCDTVFCFMTTGIAYWMIEYAIVAPLVSILSWFFWKIYKENNVKVMYFSILIIIISILFSVIIFFFQLSNNSFKFEGVNSNIFPIAIYFLISFMSISILSFLIYSIIKFKKTKDWVYINRLYVLSQLLLVIIIFRWLWGPYAYIEFYKRFFSKNIDFSKQYILSLFGIVTKSYLTIPIATIIIVPMIKVLNKYKDYEQYDNKYN